MSFHIRNAEQADIPDLAAIHIDSKKAAEKHIVPDEYLDELTQENFEKKWLGFLENGTQKIAFFDDKPAGLISYGDLRTPPPGTSKIRPLYVCEIYAIYVHPDHFEQGLGKALLKEAAQDMIAKKKNSLCLWVLEKNKRAHAFYQAMGGQRIGKQNIETGGVKTREICYGWRDLKGILT
ncbi:MAG: GNAT family N-acetyltransferase [Pseudomonadota bacterium]